MDKIDCRKRSRLVFFLLDAIIHINSQANVCESIIGNLSMQNLTVKIRFICVNIHTSEVSIVSVDLLVDQNEEQCHTDEYESEKYLILRRGSDLRFQVIVILPSIGWFSFMEPL